ncbi:FAD/NAD(P)-binding oxidoreductase [Labrenzia sp. OB1]|uniref:NAD(P)/FAD-dependent oxidoreductase n=1 Tax=Labrenzia sp. OB1 TaxID=1561204 RepID=UPI0007B26147|nr:FAD/NAD(P)-binding oxidoreductase [Labrenzia sp. OB1]KZM49559.1 nopaline dehydrogenase [Labrenzia sp. OB1]
MTGGPDLLIVGAGPAGMSAAVVARRHGLDVLVVDEQSAPGGQIWRNIETAADTSRAGILGKAYSDGADVVRRFRASGAGYLPGARVWHLEPGPRAFIAQNGVARCIDANAILLATGAQERPLPFPGWTLPGVMTVGAAQILLKSSGQIPDEPVWIAGTGPLSLLYAIQLLKAGGRIAGFLDTAPSANLAGAFRELAGAFLGAPGDMLKGFGWLMALRRQVRFIGNVKEIEAIGNEALERLRYITANGRSATVDARLLFVHEGIVPTIHPTLALGCKHIWNAAQDSFAPDLDTWGETSVSDVFVAGDGARIGGAQAACHLGELAALRVAAKAGRLSRAQLAAVAAPVRKRLKAALAIRPFLDRLYRPRSAVFVPPEATLVCRCEEVSAARILEQAAAGRPDPNQVKAFTRAGMGPCQGRQCSYTVASLLAAKEGRTVPDVGLYRVRPPFKPITLAELAALDAGAVIP